MATAFLCRPTSPHTGTGSGGDRVTVICKTSPICILYRPPSTVHRPPFTVPFIVQFPPPASGYRLQATDLKPSSFPLPPSRLSRTPQAPRIGHSRYCRGMHGPGGVCRSACCLPHLACADGRMGRLRRMQLCDRPAVLFRCKQFSGAPPCRSKSG